MRILVIGGGGREHAICWKIRRDEPGARLFIAPGNAGTLQLGTNLPFAAEDTAAILAWAKREKPDLTVVGPEAPLCAGLADLLQEAGLRVFGPGREGARLEGSKIFAKEVLRAAGAPTAGAEFFSDESEALACVRRHAFPLVIKADGIAAGKGVTICAALAEAEQAVREAMSGGAFGAAGKRILVEECLSGREVSALALVDGGKAILLPTACDHKRVFDGDRGKNTGGMGAFSPAPDESPKFSAEVLKRVFEPTLAELNRRGIVYRGVLYAGLMLTPSGMQVLEFNCRFGDPETQAILPRLSGSLVEAMNACIEGRLRPEHASCRPERSVCVVMAAGGYPDKYRKGDAIEGLDKASALENVFVFHAGTKLAEGAVVTSGGRVLGVTGIGPDARAAAANAYRGCELIGFKDAHYRRDIAARAR